jgi:transcriptional regulator with XRE-family HTH domain
MLYPTQLKAARALLELGVRDLAKLADVTTATITRFENSRGGLNASTADKLQKALEAKGLVFIEENGGGAGVRFQQPRSKP